MFCKKKTLLIFQKFPHLIKVSTIERFLPFHAACSQGHLDVLKLLVEYRSSNLNRVFTDSCGQRYLATFDLNATDVNEQNGLYAAVVANRLSIVRFLLELKFKKLSDAECEKIQAKRRRTQTSASSLIGSKSVPVDLGQQHQGFFLLFSIVSGRKQEIVKMSIIMLVGYLLFNFQVKVRRFSTT